MSKHKIFRQQSNEQQTQYTREARLQYDPDLVNESVRRWNSYSKVEQELVMDESNAIYEDLARAIDEGKSPTSEEVAVILDRWQDNIRHFYEPTLEVLAGLGDLYNTSPDFIANFEKLHTELPAFLQNAIAHYVDELETEEIKRLLADDDADSARRRLSD